MLMPLATPTQCGTNFVKNKAVKIKETLIAKGLFSYFELNLNFISLVPLHRQLHPLHQKIGFPQ